MNIRVLTKGGVTEDQTLLKALRIDSRVRIAAFVGGGGKTTLLYQLADELAAAGKRVIVTTTTHIRKPYDRVVAENDFSAIAQALQSGQVVVCGKACSATKLSAVDKADYAELTRLADFVLVEADGAKMRPLKIPAEHEPVLPEQTDLVVGVVGIDSLGQPIEKCCHRSELTAQFLHKQLTDIVESADIAKILLSTQGSQKNVSCRFAAVINKVNNKYALRKAEQIAAALPADMELIAAGRSAEECAYTKINNALLTGSSIITAVELQPVCGRRSIVDAAYINDELQNINLTKLPQLVTVGERELFVEQISGKPSLIIVGGGHVALSVARLAAMIDMQVTVIDDRIEFANAERFPMADKIICQPLDKALAGDFGENCYYVIVTRGHQGDMQALSAVLRKKRRYVGMIGSKRKVAYAMQELTAQGFSEAELASVYAPIGLKIGAVTPEEIGISIIAQIIQIMNNGIVDKSQPEIFVVLNQLINNNEPVALVTVVAKQGSSPRGTGSKMLVTEQGLQDGTIGGGIVEYQAVKRARELLKTGGCAVDEYLLNMNEAASLGMVCGGKVRVLIESVMP